MMQMTYLEPVFLIYLQLPCSPLFSLFSLSSLLLFFSQSGKSEAEELVYSHYVICNDTHETLRFGQVDTDENVLLDSLHSHQYSWRSHKSPQVSDLHSHTHMQTVTYIRTDCTASAVVCLNIWIKQNTFPCWL